MVNVPKRECVICATKAYGFECSRCDVLCCPGCLESLPMGHWRRSGFLGWLGVMYGGRGCPKCGGSIVPQESCYLCGRVLLYTDGQFACLKCGLKYCPSCDGRKLPAVQKTRTCSSCGYVLQAFAPHVYTTN